MKDITKKFIIFLTLFFINLNLNADVPYYVDFKYILNQSTAGKKAQNSLKNKLEQGLKKLSEQEKNILKEEKQLIQQKKLIKPDEYKGKVDSLRSKVLKLQKERDNLLKSVSKQRLTARNELLKNLNPIISEYMQEKKIRMVVDKKSILLADQNLDITKQIIELLNKKLKSIKLN
jgi:Skp family chaperone for outer membrane proteins